MNTQHSKTTIGITLGDPAGIGPEVTAKALLALSGHKNLQFVLIGDDVVFKHYFRKKFPFCEFIDLQQLTARQFRPGHPNQFSAQASYRYLETAVILLRRGLIQSLVTAPVSKEGITALGKKFHGHTEFFATAFGVKEFDMMFVSPQLRTIIVTRHVALKSVSSLITLEKVYATIHLANQSLKQYFHIARPIIKVCGLNPHAGEGGLIGQEELKTIIPAIQKAQKNGIQVTGPFAADTLFIPHARGKTDVIIAMYHDQGLIPVKTAHFDQLVNLTIGLPFVRTSPAHGTAFDIAGENRADFSSMKAAIELAAQLSSRSVIR